MRSAINTEMVQTSPKHSIGKVVQRIFSFPVFLGTLLLAGAYVGRLGSLIQGASASSSSFMVWLEGDTWWHLAVAARILRTHVWPTHDIYSFTAFGSPWIDYEWLGDIVLQLFWKHGRLQGLMIYTTLFAMIIMILLYYYSTVRSKNSKAAFIACALLLPLASLQFSARPQLLGYVLLIVTLICLEKFREGNRKILWLLPLVFWVWINSHGTFVLGFVILGIYWASGLREFELGRIHARRWTSSQRRQLELTFLLCLIASILTPYGTRLAAYPLKMFSSQHLIIQNIQEWQPLDLSQFYGKFFLALLVLFWVGLAISRLTFPVEDVLLMAFATVETFIHARFLLLFVPVFAPLAAKLLAQWVPKYHPGKDHYALNFALMALIAFGMIRLFPSEAHLKRGFEQKFPVQAVEFLRNHPKLSRTFNNADWGSYLLYALGPSRKVFIDGRYDIYEYIGVISDYLAITHVAPDTLFLLDKYKVDSCLIPRKSSLATFLVAAPGWKPIFQDSLSVLFVRKPESMHKKLAGGNKGQHTANRPG